MQQPWTMTCTDGALVKFGEGSEHPRAYGSYPRKLRRYVLDRHVITMEQAIHAMTGLAAAALRIKDRGELRVGAFADVLVFDPKTVTEVATYEKPNAYSKGMDYVFVNDKAAIAGGKLEPERFGTDELLEAFESECAICADESCHVAPDLAQLEGRYQAINIKLDKAGGLTAAMELLNAARSRSFRVLVGCMICRSLGIVPALHIARHADFLDLDDPWWLREDRAAGIKFEAGILHPPGDNLWGET